ncbi:hypothetical protein [Robertmurraya andreesenii]|uniref:Uncharacterized protein n=1 Tax=Anoxybacillus andreesenii TaxID=1325932 RepID=A0ABT9V6E7_9BACL|nr:hypothetical protein [Robertmurraya andreesenii]MDQ0156526.1 hypothetical protein [Robertmurraya andreesenii]
MSLIKQLEPAYISFYVTFEQVKTTANNLIKDEIGIELPIHIEAEDFNNSLKILVNIDDSSLSDEDARFLSAAGFSSETPYKNADLVLDEIFSGVARFDIEIQPLTGEDDEWGTYFVVQIPYSDYEDCLDS